MRAVYPVYEGYYAPAEMYIEEEYCHFFDYELQFIFLDCIYAPAPFWDRLENEWDALSKETLKLDPYCDDIGKRFELMYTAELMKH